LGGLGGRIADLTGLRGRIEGSSSRHVLAGTRGAIDGSRHVSTGLGGCIGGSVGIEIGVSRRDSSKAGGGIEGFGYVYAVACFLGGTLGCNSCKAFLFDFDLPWQAMQVLKTLLPRSAEALARKEESGSFWIQAKQYFEAIPDIKAWVYRHRRVRDVDIRKARAPTT